MNLPEIDPKELEEFMEREGDPAVLAILHCLRSIAVNLEAIAQFIGLENNAVSPDKFRTFIDTIEDCSVKPK